MCVDGKKKSNSTIRITLDRMFATFRMNFSVPPQDIADGHQLHYPLQVTIFNLWSMPAQRASCCSGNCVICTRKTLSWLMGFVFFSQFLLKYSSSTNIYQSLSML
jgi:hypothetical protein